MTNLRTLTATLAVAIAALPALLVPMSAATGADDVEPLNPVIDSLGLRSQADASCQESPPLDSKKGFVAVTHLGSFKAAGDVYNGCDEEGCDDQVDGTLYNGGVGRPFYVSEVRRYNDSSCVVSCHYDTGGHSGDGQRGFVDFTTYPGEVYFGCDDANGWLFGGRLQLVCEAQNQEPACNP